MSSSLPPPSSPFSYIFTPFKTSFVKNPKVKDAKITPGLDLSFHNWFSNTAAHPRPTPFPFFQNFAINSAIRSRVAGMVVMDVTVAVRKVTYRSQLGIETSPWQGLLAGFSKSGWAVLPTQLLSPA